MSSSSSQTATGASRHPKYYFPDTGCHIFLPICSVQAKRIPQPQASTFDLFVEHHFEFRTGSIYTKEEPEEFLEFCDKYECDATKQFVVDRIETSNSRFHPAELVSLATTYRLSGALPIFPLLTLRNTTAR
ncbi:hypothetical protein JVT61DRAFT_10074 [Boletus reticuloceps]|uniref:Uncharacterized protein n=1 Tax=Boletus reticuloceps TaxID=495285 RepID=A0A8I2YVW8_9AGAM|nr:hypothetical protein JVT61DRAFT_10074 [Boletus reticuloceps]